MDQIREPAANQQGQKNKQASKLGLKAARLEEELAPVGHGGRIGLENIGPFVITAAGQTGKTLIVQDLPDGGTAQEPAANQQGQKNKQASKLGLKAARLEEELAPVGHGGRIGLENIGPFVITAAGQTARC